ncbi:MAG: DUF4097 family beta strand repeat-containing protein [Gammaproteobacteria bacterium]
MNFRIPVLFVALACATLYAANTKNDTKNIDKRLPLNPDGRVTLDAHNGSIQIQTWDRAEIEIHARIEAAGSSDGDIRRFNETTVEIDGSGAAVRIKSRLPQNCCSFWPGENPQIYYTLTAPRSARWTIRNHNAKTEMRDVTAPLHIETHNGEVRVMNLSGPLNLEMHNGRANIEFAAFEAGSSVGMHNGSVELTLPRHSKFDLRSSTHRGSVDSDFPTVTRTRGRGNRDLEGSVNGGGPALRLSAHNGHFRLQAK